MQHRNCTTRRRIALLAGLFLSCATAHAAVWPDLFGSGPCHTTLQACIDAAAPGDTVTIAADDFLFPDGYTAIDENISINKSLTLTAANGIDAVFASGRSIVVNSPGSGATSVTLRRLVVQRGHVIIDHFSDTASSYFVDALRVRETDATNCAVQFFDFGSGTPQFTVGNSTIELDHSGSAACGLFAQGNGGSWQGAFSGNTIRAEHGSGSFAAMIRVIGTSAGTFRLSANTIGGSGFGSGILVTQQAGSTANTWYIDDNAISGQHSAIGDGFAAIFVEPQNSTLQIVNNTITGNSNGLRVFAPAASPDTTSGMLANNLIAFNTNDSISLGAGLAAVANRNNLLWANGFNSFAPGPGTVNADPLFVSPRNARLHAISPARDAGSNADVTLFTLDADGERRITNIVDIGAYEFSLDRALRHVSREECCNDSFIYEPFDEGIGPGERMLVTPHHGFGDALQLSQNLGIYLSEPSTSAWSVFHEDTNVVMQPRRMFSIFAPTYGYTRFVHTTTSGNVIGRYTRLPALDGGASALAFVTHNWNPGGVGGVYHDLRVGLERVGSDWYIRNEDSTVDMPVGVSFNVVVAPFFATANAWQLSVPSATSRVILSHRLLDDTPCAAPQVTRVDDPTTPTLVNDDVPFAVDYVTGYGGAPGHWMIVAEGSGTPVFPAGAAFNVMVPGAHSGACRTDDRIFADGFDP